MAPKFCSQCGAALPPNGKFCSQCGNALLPDAPPAVSPPPPVQPAALAPPPPAPPPPRPLSPSSPPPAYSPPPPRPGPFVSASAPAPAGGSIVSMGQYIGWFILSWIPVLNLIVLLIWAFSSGAEPNKKNFAKAMLVVLVIGIVLALVMNVGLFSAFRGGPGRYY